MNAAAILFVALLADAAIGEPRWLWSRVPHPAVVMGNLIGWMDRTFNKGRNRRAKGVLCLIALLVMAAMIGHFIDQLAVGPIVEIILVAILIAQKSLSDHVGAVANGLRISLDIGKVQVAKIVGRDTADMDESAVARGAIESAAENLSDGVIAPAFWFLIFGLPGLLVYKITNTADSMIGYKTARHLEFGWAAARFDDLINWVPARLSTILIALANFDFGAWRVIGRDATLHRSPNAGWPEAAMASTLNVALSGPRSYGGESRDFPFVNSEGRRIIGADEIDGTVRALWRTWALILAVVAILAIVSL